MRKRKEAFVEEKIEAKKQMESTNNKQRGRKLAWLAIISIVIYEALLSILFF